MVSNGQTNGNGGGQLPPDVDGSGASDLVGYRSYWPGEVGGACSLEVGPQHLNRLGILHGGFVSMLLDNGCGIAVRNAVGNADAVVVTVSIAINFIDSVSEGLVTATGHVAGGGKSMKFAEAELRDATGRLLASATATFRVFGTA
ncbi:PaaI family thioesterase [Paracoccus aurantiacus]|uniref:PaaI family thioesterase n=1 Tax=Paracoccus aurantiacus TaxID=2599412 RepID=A0A5C6RP45_9RHOB|nr:PaaI family thioesterase [Paracoccus aurantiacus]TXB63430.1 PaaI family thioesterase [Paracoccus aurantiacus]